MNMSHALIIGALASIATCSSSLAEQSKKPQQKKEAATESAAASKEEKNCTPKPAADDDEGSEKRVLMVFSQMLTNFICILKDPKNPANVGANLTALFAGIVNIGLEMFRHEQGQQAHDWGTLDEQDLALIEKIKSQLILAVQEMEAQKNTATAQEIA